MSIGPSVVSPSASTAFGPTESTAPTAATPAETAATPTIPPATPRPSYKSYPLVTVPIEAIQVADDDGSRGASIDAEQVAWWVGEANKIFAVAGVRFAFDPAKDFTTLRNTVVNDVTDPNVAPSQWAAATVADRVATRYEDRLTILFRHGPGPVGVYDAFSSPGLNFVAMPGYLAGPCGHVDTSMLAHEIGHYFGLLHTFVGPYPDVAAAAAALKAAGGDPAAFDGDGLSDTPPDPFISADRCGPESSVTLDGTTFLLPRSNVMSYYDAETDLSPEQITLLRSVLALRIADGMAFPANGQLSSPIEAEDLPMTSTPPGACSSQDMSPQGIGRWSGGRQLTCFFNGVGDSVELVLPPVVKAARYRLTLYLTRGQGYGTVQPILDGRQVGRPFDGSAPVAAVPAPPLALDLGRLEAGAHDLTLRVTGTNSPAGTFIAGLDALTLEPAP